jgi:hypothetical protein
MQMKGDRERERERESEEAPMMRGMVCNVCMVVEPTSLEPLS